jgi:hypothetical protein
MSPFWLFFVVFSVGWRLELLGAFYAQEKNISF